jgi:hypothetical protein
MKEDDLGDLSLRFDRYIKPKGCICEHNKNGLLVHIDFNCPEHQALPPKEEKNLFTSKVEVIEVTDGC